jgi:hypothetical protein
MASFVPGPVPLVLPEHKLAELIELIAEHVVSPVS